MSGAETRRLFLALWPDETVRQALTEVQQRLPLETGRAVDRDNLHLTLVFLGPTPPARQRCIEQAVDGIAAPGFELRLDRLGHWRKPQVSWLGSADTPPPLAALVLGLQEAVVRCGATVDERPFQVHLTLFRKVVKPPRALPSVAPIVWRVRSLVLVESVTAAAGAQYRVLREWPLSGSTSS